MGGTERSWATAACLLALAGCGGAQAPSSAQPLADPVGARATEVRAAERAPDLWARAEQADQLAAKAAEGGDTDAEADHRTEARLWREAAVAEAERIETSEARLAVEHVIEADTLALQELDEQRRPLHARAERLAAGAIALEEARRMLTLAATDKRRRPKLTDEELRAGAGALVQRAQLVVEAARSMGAAPAELQGVEKQISRAQRALKRDPAGALALADQALFEAHASFGPVRTQHRDATVREASRSLAEALHAAGFEVGRSERGLVAGFPGAGAPGAAARRPIQRLCKLAAGFPAGSLQVVALAPGATAAKTQLRAAKRLFSGAKCPAQRMQWISATTATGTPRSEVVWLAY